MADDSPEADVRLVAADGTNLEARLCVPPAATAGAVRVQPDPLMDGDLDSPSRRGSLANWVDGVEVLAGTDHFLAGALGRITERVLSLLAGAD